MKKKFEYAAKINDQIAQMFDENSENYINLNELDEGDNFTLFIHALANIAPTVIFNKLASEDKNQLEFNHLANNLVFQYAEKKDE